MRCNYITPAITAFNEKKQLDREALEGLYDHLIRGGVDGILVLGSIGEFFAIPVESKKELIRLAIRHIDRRTKVLVGTASMDVNETVELSKYACEQGADGIVVISPYYFSLSNESIEEYYDLVAKECPGDLYLYNFPDRTGYDLSPEVTLKLLRKHKNIAGYKDTIPGMDHTRELIKLIKPEFPEFKIYSGFDDNFAHNVLSGGDGCIGGLSNLVPDICSSWVSAFRENDFDSVAGIQRKIDRLMDIYQVGKPFVPYIKKAMMLKGIPVKDYCSFPLPAVNEAQVSKLWDILKKTNVI
ncbi:MAG: dihydrodipicolinate synthetase [Eubacterium sp.]|jgi:4-hydroxy-tetrahydrodipicolinate synthase|nr:dihydrodipicolinate synthetase [Eubacterium sp.]